MARLSVSCRSRARNRTSRFFVSGIGNAASGWHDTAPQLTTCRSCLTHFSSDEAGFCVGSTVVLFAVGICKPRVSIYENRSVVKGLSLPVRSAVLHCGCPRLKGSSVTPLRCSQASNRPPMRENRVISDPSGHCKCPNSFCGGQLCRCHFNQRVLFDSLSRGDSQDGCAHNLPADATSKVP